MSLGPDFHLVDLPKTDWEKEAFQYRKLIIEDKLVGLLDTTQFSVSLASINWDSKAIPDLLKAYGEPEFDSLLQAKGKKYYLLTRKTSQ